MFFLKEKIGQLVKPIRLGRITSFWLVQSRFFKNTLFFDITGPNTWPILNKIDPNDQSNPVFRTMAQIKLKTCLVSKIEHGIKIGCLNSNFYI